LTHKDEGDHAAQEFSVGRRLREARRAARVVNATLTPDIGHANHSDMMTRRTTWALALTMTIGAAVLTAAPAAHAATGIEYISTTSSSDSTSPKSLVVTCPAGKVPINGSAYLTGAVGNALIRQIVPLQIFGGMFLSVVADEDADGYAGSWSVTATAVCVPTPSGYSLVSASLTDPSSAWVTVACGTKRVVGGGYIVSPTGSMMATGIETDSRNRAYLSAERTLLPGSASSVTGTVVAVCVDANALPVRQVSATGPINSTSPKSLTTTCPAGTQVVGVGGDLWWLRHHTVIDDFRINSATNSVTITGYEDQIGNPDGWAIDTYAVCAL
jgi:hypothetical protein